MEASYDIIVKQDSGFGWASKKGTQMVRSRALSLSRGAGRKLEERGQHRSPRSGPECGSSECAIVQVCESLMTRAQKRKRQRARGRGEMRKGDASRTERILEGAKLDLKELGWAKN